MNLKNTYNAIATDFYKEHVEATWWIEGVQKFITFLPKDADVLDIGCGPGYKSNHLSEHGKKVIGLDFSESMLRIAKNRLPEATFVCADITKPLPFNKRFDGILAEAVLLHIKRSKIAMVIKSISKDIKIDGYLYVSLKDVENGIEEEIKKEKKYGKTFERFFSYYTRDEMKELLVNAGYEIVYKKIHPENTRWLQMIGKKRR